MGVSRPTEVTPLFILSLPRSGSTLLQRILAAHDEVSTAPEPWVLLPLVWTLHPEEAFTAYSHQWAVEGIGELINRMDGGRDAYLEEIGTFARRVYGRASDPGARYFLDKTPRYHLIVDELFELFPDGRFVFLWRNPLAVLASTLETWLDGRWRPELHKVDLYEGFENLHRAWMARKDDPRVLTIRYEDLVLDPEGEAAALLAGLGLAPDESVVERQAEVDLDAAVGDPSAMRKQGVSRKSPDAWTAMLGGRVRKKWCDEYLDWLGAERLAHLGYDQDGLRAAVAAAGASPTGVTSDWVETIKGNLGTVLELDQMRAKRARKDLWHRVYRHT